MREHFGNAPFMHRCHRYAISDVVAFIGATFVERQSGKKVIVSLWYYFGTSIREKLFDDRDGSEACFVAMLSEEIQYFNQDGISRDQQRIVKQRCCRECWAAPFVVGLIKATQ